MITIHKAGIRSAIRESDLSLLQNDFRQNHFILLRNLIQADLLEELYSAISKADWQERIHDGIGVEVCLNDPGTVGLMNFLLNDPDLFQWIQRITGCETIGCFQGRAYRMTPNSGHYDSWHSDIGEYRLLALSINFGKEPYEGGLLQIQQNGSTDPAIDVPNLHFGNAILFQLSTDLKHRVTDVTGKHSKTAFAGWFKSSPDLWSSLSDLARLNPPAS